MKLPAMARLLGATTEEAESVLHEISETGIGDVQTNQDGTISIICRRTQRDWEAAEKRHSTLSEAGKRGAAKRHKPDDGHPTRQANGHPIERPIAIQKPEARSQNNIPPTAREAEDIPDDLLTEDQSASQAHTAGIPEDFAKYVFPDWHSRGGKDGSGVKVPWAGYCKKRWNRESQEWIAGTHRGKQSQGGKKNGTDRQRTSGNLNSTAGSSIKHL